MANENARPLGTLVDIGEGRFLHCVAAGSGSPTVVFESGGGGGSSIQDLPVLRLVSAFTRACGYDRAGLGWSSPAPPGRSFEARASDLHALLARTESGPYVLVGLSFGGLLARTFCSLYADEVVGMVLVDAAEEEKYFSTMLEMRPFHEQELRGAAAAAEAGEMEQRFETTLRHADLFTDEEKAAMVEVVSRPSHFLTALEELSAIDRAPAAMTRAGGLGTLGDRPLVVISHGIPYTGVMAPWEEGFMQSQQRLTALSTNSAHVIASGVGHSIAVEHPRLVAAAIRAVVEAVSGAPFDAAEVERLAASPRV